MQGRTRPVTINKALAGRQRRFGSSRPQEDVLPHGYASRATGSYRHSCNDRRGGACFPRVRHPKTGQTITILDRRGLVAPRWRCTAGHHRQKKAQQGHGQLHSHHRLVLGRSSLLLWSAKNAEVEPPHGWRKQPHPNSKTHARHIIIAGSTPPEPQRLRALAHAVIASTRGNIHHALSKTSHRGPSQPQRGARAVHIPLPERHILIHRQP